MWRCPHQLNVCAVRRSQPQLIKLELLSWVQSGASQSMRVLMLCASMFGFNLQACYFTYRQHYGTRDIRDEPQHEWVLSCMKANIHLCLFNNKLHHIQVIQIYRLSAINKLVLGLAWKKNACYTTQLCSEQNPVKVSFCWSSLHWLQVPTFYTMMYCWYIQCTHTLPILCLFSLHIISSQLHSL